MSAVTDRVTRLRAGVLGANDGIVSTAGIVTGISAATTSPGAVLAVGVAGVAAGMMSMALGEYVSVSAQRDSERELGMPAADMAKPSYAAAASAVAFLAGGVLPLLAVLAAPSPGWRVPVVAVAVLVALTVTGVIAARLADTPAFRPTVRVVAGGGVAMAVTYAIGAAAGLSGT